MDIRKLEYFLALAREESVSAAAESLHMTQPPLSRQLKELEQELGKQLFIRGNRKITLTDEGFILRKRAEEILELLNKTEAEIRTSNDSISGDIYIGCAETDVMRILFKTIKKVRMTYPNIHFHLISGYDQTVIERLDRGLLDFGVFLEPTNMQKYDYIQLPQKDTWGVLMRKDDPLATKNFVTPKDLLTLPLIFSSQELFSNHFSSWLGSNIDKLNIVATYNLLYNASLMVEEGLGYAVGIDNIISTIDGSPLCFKPLLPLLESNINISWKKYQVFSKASEVFLNQLQQDSL